MKYSAVGAGLLAFSVCARASAAGAPEKQLEFGFSGGYAATDNVLHITHAIPVGVSGGYRFTRSWGVGVFGEYGFLGSDIITSDSNVTTSGSHLRLGVQVRYQVEPDKIVNPWLGVGLGFDRLSYDASGSSFGGPYAYHRATSGLELLSVAFGVEFHLAPAFALGPYVNGSLVDYVTIQPSADEQVPGMQLWIMLGARASLYL